MEQSKIVLLIQYKTKRHGMSMFHIIKLNKAKETICGRVPHADYVINSGKISDVECKACRYWYTHTKVGEK